MPDIATFTTGTLHPSSFLETSVAKRDDNQRARRFCSQVVYSVILLNLHAIEYYLDVACA